MFAFRFIQFRYAASLASLVFLIAGTDSSFSTLQANACNQSSKMTIYDRIGKQFLPSIADATLQDAKNCQSQEKHSDKNTDNTIEKITSSTVTPTEKFNIFFNTLSECSPEQLPSSKDVINTATCSDMELLCGDNPDDLSRHMLSCVNHTLTTAGNIELQRILFSPLSDIKQLKNRQKIVKELVNNEQLFNQIEELLQNLKKTEDEIASFWKHQNASLTPLFQDTYFKFPLVSSLFNSLNSDSFNSFVKALNNSSLALEIRHLRKIFPAPRITIYSYLIASSLIHFYESGSFNIWSLVYGLLLYQTYNQIKNYHTLTKIIQKKMINVATYINSIKKLADILEKNEILASRISSFKDLKKVGCSDKQTEKLVNLLKTSTFKGEASFFSNHGKSLVALNIMKDAKASLIKGFIAAGQLDAYMSIAKLYKKYQNHQNVTYCFVTFEKRSKPHLKVDEFWHPFLNSEKAVPNSIELGGNQGNNIVVTGPNAGGKSTMLKGMTTALLLAQSFGIAPARAMRVTPFAKIRTYLNIADTQGKESLFQAEMRRITETVTMMESLKKDEFCFIIMDEIFTGTNPREAEEAAYRVGKVLTNFDNSICILATHFKKLTQLEQETNGFYKNYKVWVTENTDGTFYCPYKITPGISDQSIALKLLQQQGLFSHTLQKAFDDLNVDRNTGSEVAA